jgi:hypothetical protein
MTATTSPVNRTLKEQVTRGRVFRNLAAVCDAVAASSSGISQRGACRSWALSRPLESNVRPTVTWRPRDWANRHNRVSREPGAVPRQERCSSKQ